MGTLDQPDILSKDFNVFINLIRLGDLDGTDYELDGSLWTDFDFDFRYSFEDKNRAAIQLNQKGDFGFEIVYEKLVVMKFEHDPPFKFWESHTLAKTIHKFLEYFYEVRLSDNFPENPRTLYIQNAEHLKKYNFKMNRCEDRPLKWIKPNSILLLEDMSKTKVVSEDGEKGGYHTVSNRGKDFVRYDQILNTLREGTPKSTKRSGIVI